MNTAKKFVERRKYKRFKTRPGVNAVLMPNYQKLGKIINISLGGLAFHYYIIDNEDRSEEFFELNIFANNSICLENVPFIQISENRIDNDMPFDSMVRMQRGIAFKEFSPELRADMIKLIKTHAIVSV